MRRMIRATLALALVAGLAHAQPNGKSDTVAVRTRDGDSYGLLAAEYYGDRKHALFIHLENGIKQPKPLRAGTRLRIPVAREIVTAPKDTFATLAETYLGDAKRDHYLAQFNRTSPEESPAAGTTLVVPFTVTYTPQAPESLAAIAAKYLGSATHADLLRRYNFLDDIEVDKGQAVVIPAFHVKLQPSKVKAPDSSAKARRELRETTQQRAGDALPRARHAWRVGDFAEVRKQLADLDLAYLAMPAAIEAGILLGSAHLAYGDEAAARTAFERVLDRNPSHQLSPFAHSPKVLAVWKQAVGDPQ